MPIWLIADAIQKTTQNYCSIYLVIKYGELWGDGKERGSEKKHEDCILFVYLTVINRQYQLEK